MNNRAGEQLGEKIFGWVAYQLAVEGEKEFLMRFYRGDGLDSTRWRGWLGLFGWVAFTAIMYRPLPDGC